jgi:hypothetical protein
MPFDPSKFDFTMILIMLTTVGMMVVRTKARLENNWPMFYWLTLLYITYTRTDTWDFNLIAGGAAAGLLLRFEVMAAALVTTAQLVEFAAWGYILYHGCRIVFYQ